MRIDPAPANTKLDFAKRLSQAMEEAGYSPKPSVLEREFNQRFDGKPMTLHGVRRWLLGETLPSQDKLLVLAEWLDVPPHQLRFGEDLTNRIEARRARWDRSVSAQDRDALEAYLSLPIAQRRVLREVIAAFASAASTDPAN
jgi:hypothetical protein